MEKKKGNMRVLFGMCVSSIIQEFVPMLTNNSKKNFKSQRPSLAHIKKNGKITIKKNCNVRILFGMCRKNKELLTISNIEKKRLTWKKRQHERTFGMCRKNKELLTISNMEKKLNWKKKAT